MPQRILCVDDDPMMRQLVAITLGATGYEIHTAADGGEALAAARSLRPDLVVLDVVMPDIDGYEVCRRLRAMPELTHVPVIMLTSADDVETRIRSFDAGADNFVRKPFDPDELQARARALLQWTASAQAPPPVSGRVTAVFALRGGVGVSTLAANLAAGLAQIWSAPVALVDLALTCGQSALLLNLAPHGSWADLTRFPAAEIDEDMVLQTMLRHPTGVRVLPAPPRPELRELVGSALVTHVLDMVRRRHPYVVIDLPHDFAESTVAALDAADLALLLLAPDLASVRAAATTLDVFEALGYPPDRIRLVLNWTFERRGLQRADIEAALRRPIDIVLPFAPDAFVDAINAGVPPVLASPQPPIGAALEDLAFVLSPPEQRQQRPARPSEAWQRVAQRAQARRSRRQ